MDGLTIGEIARQAGLATSAIRYYERLGLLPKSKRINGHRRFDSSVLGWLSLIGVAQQAGFTLAEIDVLLHGFDADTPPSERWRTLAAQKLPEVDALITRAEGMKQMLEKGLRCECVRLEDCAVGLAEVAPTAL